MVDDLRDAINEELEQLIEDGELNLLNPGPDIIESLQDIRDSVVPDFWESIGMVIEAGGDPDDIIGFRLFLFAAVDNTVPINFPAVANVTSGRLITREFLIGASPTLCYLHPKILMLIKQLTQREKLLYHGERSRANKSTAWLKIELELW